MKILTDFFCLLAIHIVHGRQMNDDKTWIPDTNFDNPQNWDGGRLPCGRQRAIFPSDGKVVSILASPVAVSELVLPLDGQFVFTNDAELVLTGGVGESACVRKDVRFIVRSVSWYDPNNWNVSSWRIFSSKSSSGNPAAAIPHAYRVPCRTDHVTFPSGRSFKVHVEDPVTVATMSINNVNYYNEEMSNFLVSQTGNLLFPGIPMITINRNECLELSGCTCGNDDPQMMSRICKHIQQCPSVQCSDPVQPTGHCCKICASFLVMEYEKNFKIETLLDLHEEYLGKGEFVEVLSYTSRTYEDKIQAVFVDGGENKGMAADVAQKVYNTLTHDINSAKFYKLRLVMLYSSTNWNSGVPVHGSLKGVSSGGIVGILFAAVLVIGSIFGALYIYRKRHIPGFSFARFDVNVGNIQVELGTTPHEVLQPDEPVSSERELDDKAFDNPVYGKASTSRKEKPDPDISAEEEKFVENPMFMLYEDRPDSASTEP